ncbi:MAG: RnfABCDGE type electron transport complex subunit D [Candidatus Dormibacteraeota bacterium]|nr:RnfABCDGE type electron transport complex subunit D [Candidatus Dormibacteraeota bacterium]
MAKSVLERLGRALVRPQTAPAAVVLGTALTPSLAAGLLLFRGPAVEILAAALVIGGAAQLAARWLRLPAAPLLAGLIGVAFVGPGTSPLLAALVALVGSLLELGRARLAPGLRLQAGLLAYVGALLMARGLVTIYVNPATGSPVAEPIRLWLDLNGGQSPIDPIKLYVGNVAGPVFATSLLAVVLGAAWLWYARRLSLPTLVAFAAGAIAPVIYYRWSLPFQLISGPLWFAGALLLSDRSYLPDSRIGQPLVGLAAGLLALMARARGLAIESVMEATLLVQLVAAGATAALSPLTGSRPSPTPAPAQPGRPKSGPRARPSASAQARTPSSERAKRRAKSLRT